MDRHRILKTRGGIDLGTGASGRLPTKMATALDNHKTGGEVYDGITADDLQRKKIGGPGAFCNWFFNVTFEHKGLPHVLFASIKAPGFSGKNEISVIGVRGPFKTRQEKALDIEDAEGGIVKDEADKTKAAEENISVLEDPEWHFRQVFFKSDDAFKQTVENKSVNIQLGDTTVSCGQDSYTLRLMEEDTRLDLDCKARGPAIWWGGEPNKTFHLTRNSLQNGFEIPCDLEGTAVLRGESIRVKGRGVFEHVWIEKLDMMELRAVDYVIMHFDEAYVFLFKGVSITQEDLRLHHNHTGAVYLNEEKKLLPITGIRVNYGGWAYAPKAYRFIPTTYHITADTTEGSIQMDLEPAACPAWYVHRRMDRLRMDQMEGWNFAYWDALLKGGGAFTYNNGKVLKLTHGLGINEPQRVSLLT
jgi:hypothetical protein